MDLQPRHPAGDGRHRRAVWPLRPVHGRGHGDLRGVRDEHPAQGRRSFRPAARHAAVRGAHHPFSHRSCARRHARHGRDPIRGIRRSRHECARQQRLHAALALGRRRPAGRAHPSRRQDTLRSVPRQHDRIVVRQRPGARHPVPLHTSGRLRPAGRSGCAARPRGLSRASGDVRPQGRQDRLG